MRKNTLKKAGISLFLCVILAGCGRDRVCFSDDCFNVETADTEAERELGLMYRESLDESAGMLFVFPEDGQYLFWMKNTKIQLDMIWLDNNLNVVYISRDTAPCIADPCPGYGPSEAARYVLEINGGMSDKLGIKEGDAAIIDVKTAQ